MAVNDWDTNAASNTSIDGVNIDEGCSPGGINNALRSIMAAIRAWTVPISQGGTGATDAATARSNLGLSADPTFTGTTTVGRMTVGGNTVGTETDLALAANAVIASEDVINFCVETDGFFNWYTGIDDVLTGRGGGSQVARLDTNGNFDIEGYFRVSATGDASPTSTGHGLQIGPTGGANLRLDNDEIQAVDNGAAATFGINSDGGDINFGSAGANVNFASDVSGTGVATQAEAQAGTLNTKIMTPQRVLEAIIEKFATDKVGQYRFWEATIGLSANDTIIFPNSPYSWRAVYAISQGDVGLFERV